tara:strand:+ start:593 stop:1408 length:816 start_codon:yes stop_codon:yes gene_type:complete
MTINEVAPPGFGHTKGDKGKGVKKGGTAAAFDKARKEGRFKGSKSDMFAIMWSQKNKGDKPHYKPGTDKKYKKYQGVNESVQNNKVDLILKTDVNNVLKQDNKDYDRGLLAKVNKDGSYDVAYWYDEYKAYPVEVVIDGKSIKKDAKNIHIKYHPELKKKNKEEAKDAMKEETSMRKKRDVTKSKPKAPQFDAAKELVINAPYMKPALQQREGTSYKTFMSDVQSAKDRLKKKVEDRKKKDAQFVDTKTKGVRFFDKKGKGRIVKGRKVYD